MADNQKVNLVRIDVEEICKWFFGCAMAVGIALAPVSCYQKSKEADNLVEARIEQAIKSGVDPIDARCAFVGSDSSSNGGTNPSCTIRAAFNKPSPKGVQP